MRAARTGADYRCRARPDEFRPATVPSVRADAGGTSDPRAPDYAGGSLVNLVAELERRLAGSCASARLHGPLAGLIPEASTYILFMIDGLGARRLDHPAAGGLAAALRGVLDAPFPTTTSVSLASAATGLAPRRHGLIGHFVLLAGFSKPINSLRWQYSGGKAVSFRTEGFLPRPNLWERLAAAGAEPITVQPADYEGTPLTKALYRGCRFEGAASLDHFVTAAAGLAEPPGRLVFAYYPAVDAAAHKHGMDSPEYARALGSAAYLWEGIAARLPAGAVMVGTADHGLAAVPRSGKRRLHRRRTPGLTLYGDPRVLYVRGPADRIEELADSLPADLLSRKDLEPLWGPPDGVGGGGGETPIGPIGPPAPVEKPDGALLAHDGCALLPGHFDKRMIGYHGGLTPEELEIPLLVATPQT